MLPDNSTIIDPVGPPHTPTDTPADPQRCKLLGTTGLVVQALMGILVIASLVVKKRLEKRKRSWRIWFLDVSKQLVGQAVVHALNLLISDLVASVGNSNPCSLYFLNILIDTTIGVGIIFLSLKFFTWLFSSYLGYDGFISGKYGNPPQALFWWKQLLTYVFSIIIMKLLVLLPLTLPRISDLLLHLGHYMLEYFSPSVQVIFVMAIFPLIMNIVQFCLVDQVIKAGGKADDEEGRIHDTGDEEEGYSRVPDWENDLDGHGRGSGEGSPREMTKKEEEETMARATGISTALPPSSPLLSPARYDGYGSTTPSPVGSPTKSVEGQNMWTKMMSKSKDTGGGSSNNASLKERHGVNSRKSSNTWWEYPDDEDEDGGGGLEAPIQRNTRSHAPSPESVYPAELPPPFVVNGSSAAAFRKNSRTPPEWGASSTHSSHTARRLTSEVEREARLTLSPPRSPRVENSSSGGGGGGGGNGRSERGEEVGLDVLRR
ncbi:hypothetical protein CNBC2820 [Cryptococcus deneoformans B-3501A]|uniref:hypothetical protein n=1 Tax=Cryptococcus deneoformans (strain B-3501A) TaxID=283643 RepID=UPI000042EB1D|nr:hypothetical protein CNBC2820 [Cryptococcus neoformans var. neoformans B-3501A]EAL22144.1 hypothetical protein CNBC2820 [Cryptococcus neoformans var. neoformans B-3501A]